MYSRFFEIFVNLIPPKPLLKLDPSKQRQTGAVLERSRSSDLPVGLGSGGVPGAILDRQKTGTPRGNGQAWLKGPPNKGVNLALSREGCAGTGMRRACLFDQCIGCRILARPLLGTMFC